jgi:hypothetical protein
MTTSPKRVNGKCGKSPSWSSGSRLIGAAPTAGNTVPQLWRESLSRGVNVGSRRIRSTITNFNIYVDTRLYKVERLACARCCPAPDGTAHRDNWGGILSGLGHQRHHITVSGNRIRMQRKLVCSTARWAGTQAVTITNNKISSGRERPIATYPRQQECCFVQYPFTEPTSDLCYLDQNIMGNISEQ